MKKLLKSFGVLSLIIAILLPFAELPKVNAETTECETHLQNYMFLDAIAAPSLDLYEEGYSTWGSFPYAFPEQDDNYDVNVTRVTQSQIVDENQIARYWNLYGSIYNSQTRRCEMNGTYKDDYYCSLGRNSGSIFVTNSPYDGYASNTILLHGRWGQYDKYGNIISSNNSAWIAADDDDTLQLKISDSRDLLAGMNARVEGALYTGNNTYTNYPNFYSTSINNPFELSNENYLTNLADYFNDIIDGNTSENSTWINTSNNNIKYIPLKITRRFTDNMEDFNDYVFGFKNVTDESNIHYYVYTESSTVAKISDVDNSFDAMNESTETKLNYIEVTKDIYKDIDFEVYVQDGEEDFEYTSYYWPFVLNVEYTVCPVENSAEPENPEDPGDEVPVGEWSIKYNANVKDVTTVTNMPKNQKANIGTDITLDSKKPSRDGYTFKAWCENKDGSGECYNAGDTIKSPEKTDIIELFADWGKTDTENPGKWGVMSYIIGFMSVGIVAGGIYLISKKKNLFKQI